VSNAVEWIPVFRFCIRRYTVAVIIVCFTVVILERSEESPHFVVAVAAAVACFTHVILSEVAHGTL
jgi:hypothetical protein